METKTNISVILPVHELADETCIKLFKNSLKSLSEQKVAPDELLIVYPKGSEVETLLSGFDFSEYKISVRLVANEGKTDFQSQVNRAMEDVNTEWFSILEFDDEYSVNWFKNVVTYIDAHQDVEMFLPIIIDTDENGEFIGLSNEAVWANSFSDELGYLDNGALLAYQNFNIDGFVMKKEVFQDNGGFKTNIKLTFIYEFLLRMTFKDVRVMVIPRFGYKHMNNRPNSLFQTYKSEMNPVESNWWLAQAKKEYYFPNEREITYQDN